MRSDFSILTYIPVGLFSANALPGPAGHTAKPVDVARATVDAPFPFLPNFGPTTAPSSLQNDSTIPVYNGTTHITLEMIWALIRIPMDQRRMWGPWLGPTLGTVPRNSDQYCWYPHNPDIAGIGVRTTLYIQSLVVVVLSLVSRFRQKSPSESLSGIQRTQVYTVFAFVIAGLEQRGTGQLSIFHETIAVHLAFLSISSAWIGMPASVEEPAEQWLVPGLSEHPRLAYLFRSANWHNASGGFRLVIQSVVRSMAELGADWYSMLLMLPVVYGIGYDFHQNVETCFPDVGEAWASRGDLKWLAYRLLIMKWFIPIAIGALIGIIGYRASNLGVPKVVKAWKLQQRAIQLGVVLFLVVWVLEVIAIEGSLKNLPYFHTAEEDQWGFGQIFPLVLLLPLWEAISDVLFARREEMSLAATINRQHREACIQSQCDVQLVYDRENIRCGFHLTPYISHLVLETLPASAYVIVTDSNVAPLHLATLEQQLRIGSSSARIILYVAPTGTTFKSRELAGQLEDYLVENHCEADTVLIALGGGTVADLGGFVAATL
ncbi:hypothetical protein DFH09DRAFT_1485109 [Mycena vulgaris]|nr:hypothetical protein DFH09DRAFT_1485109 [Mycena vulgaris]